ncbi:DUF6087 family protein [Kitasatospora sp. Ki12]|uniref:DUF6087 family protein n=1 Tax=Streptomycetaceae TaxID=2062 RepID=UPI0016752F32|nr:MULTISPECIES: DUF6087 family protein [Streptomycetaceae]GGZ30827.1 hypothetical protein GCM10010327_70830 [Streptomyces nitrosporeus]GHF80217.1 hypothetical protein GCM10018790_67540 [Kitasatospora xanthocidica]
MDEEEPLASWAARREQRLRPVGQLRAVRLADGRPGGAHVAPGEPRLIVRWDGYQWLPETVAEDYAAAQRILHGVEGDGLRRPGYRAPRPTKPPGRHRKPRGV